ncbi:MAG: DnaJ domain-containing protein [Myxococcota bacterium]
MPASGTLGAPHSPQRLYYLAAATERTGLLTLVLPDREVVIHFKKGNPEFLDSTHPEDSLDTFLVNQKLVTPAQVEQATAQRARFGGELLPALFGLGLVNPNAVFQHLAQRASQLLFRALTAEQGTFAFDLEELPAARAMPLGNRWAVYLEALRRVPGPDLRRRLLSAFELPVMKAGGLVPVTDLKLTPQETRALNYFDGVRSLSQLVSDLPAEADVVVRTAWMLAPLDLVSFAGVSPSAVRGPPPPAAAAPPPKVVAPPPAAPVAPPRAPQVTHAPTVVPPVVAAPRPPQPVAAPARPPPPVMSPQPAAAPQAPAPRPPGPPPGNPAQMPKPASPYPAGAAPARPPPPVMAPAAPKPPAPAAPPAGNVAEEIKQLQALHDQLKGKNYFDVLGVKRDADPNAVKIAYLKAARSYHPDTVPPGAPEALGKLKADLFALIGEANRTLSDPALRQEYVAELDAGGTGSKVDIEKILRGEELFQKGRILVQARKYPDALKMIDEAITANPEEPEFYAWRGYARFMAAPDRKLATAEAMKDIKGCIDKNPNVAAAHYFAGYVAKTNGDMKTAIAEFKKTVALDPRHIDAARELRNVK